MATETAVPTSVQTTPLSTYVGFDTITRQIEKKLLKKGFLFNLLLVGQTGLGKTTLLNTLFASHLIDSKAPKKPSLSVRQTTEIVKVSHVLEENGVQLALNIVDTPGYGDLVNNDGCWEPIVNYIREQHNEYLRKELTAERDQSFRDPRVHCCLYFLSPTGHALKPIDIIVLQKISQIVNVIPLIAKADSLTMEERAHFKRRIQEELTFHNIKLYPYDSPNDDKEERALNDVIRRTIPFAVIGSERNVVVDGKAVRGRRNRWGTVNVENENHCEFNQLRTFLTQTHLQDLIETTSTVHYEIVRERTLKALAARHSLNQADASQTAAGGSNEAS